MRFNVDFGLRQAIASFYETKGEAAKAGQFFRKCDQYGKALRLFLQCGGEEINAAIDVVGEARSEVLTNTLIDFLMGESDGVPKDPQFIFRLYMALGKYPEAVRTANIIAQQEQELGNYKHAHELLFDTFKDLEADKKRVPRELYINLCLLHSYVLVKYLLPMGDHKTAARMLLRVSKHITRFPSHTVPILTSTVVECMKAGLKKSALEYAAMLMRPEHRAQISDTYKRKIETMVRKRDKGVEEDDEVSFRAVQCGSVRSRTV
jgi:WD repeat-containing protein 19